MVEVWWFPSDLWCLSVKHAGCCVSTSPTHGSVFDGVCCVGRGKRFCDAALEGYVVGGIVSGGLCFVLRCGGANVVEAVTKNPVPADESKKALGSSTVTEKSNKELTGLESKYFWSAVAMGTLLLGAGCLVMAMSLSGPPTRGHRRRASLSNLG